MTDWVVDAGVNKVFGVFPTEEETMRLVRALASVDEVVAEQERAEPRRRLASHMSPLGLRRVMMYRDRGIA
ncbi:MAG TPA: hypothetical protein VFU81_11815 [Thermomicrobiales bacterium]|nr:hypothetical protein [Thermomicrobiales bacterium]